MVWTFCKKKQELAITPFLAFSSLLLKRAAIKVHLHGKIFL